LHARSRRKLVRVALWGVLVTALACEPDRSSIRSPAPLLDLHLPGGGWLHEAASYRRPHLDSSAAPKLSQETRIEKNASLRALQAVARGDWEGATRFLDLAVEHGLPPYIAASDKAAVALAAAATGKDPLGRVAALTASDQAIRANPGSERAWYNRALVLEQLELSSSATAAWRRYLELASDTSTRVEEARRHFHRLVVAKGSETCLSRSAGWHNWLEDPRVEHEPNNNVEGGTQALRLFLEDHLLPAWAEAHVRRDTRRAQVLSKAGLRLARVIVARSGDSMPLEIANGAIAAGSTGARALLEYREGRVAFRQLQYEKCVDKLGDAVKLLGALGNPGELRARAYRAACLVRLARTTEAATEFHDLKTSAYPGIRAHAAEQLGAMHSLRGAPAYALPLFREAATLLAKHDELASLAIVQGEIADSLFVLGDIEGAWRTMEDALRTGARSCNTYVNGTNVWTAGDLLLRAGALEAASALLRESLAIEQSGGDPALIVETLRTVALNDTHLRRIDEAIAGVREARVLLRKVASTSVQETQMGFLDWIEGTAISERDPAGAARLLARALPRLKRSGRDSEWTAALLTRGGTLLAIGEREAGRAYLRLAIGAYERLRDHVATMTDPAWSFAKAEPAFDALTASLLADGLVSESLASSERGRRPFIIHSGVEAKSPTPSATVGVLVLDQMDRRLVAWWIVGERLSHWTFDWSRETTRHRVTDLCSRLWGKSDEGPLRRLAADLLSPISRDLVALDRIVIVPEDALAALPWSALPHPQGGRWIDHLVVTLAPSLSIASSPRRHYPEPEALVVAGATTTDDSGLRLPSLPGAREEGIRIAGAYSSATLLLDHRATREAVLRHWTSADILHFAVHAVVDDTLPSTARLALSNVDGSIGHLTATDIASTRFTRRPLVVLSACSTRAGRLLPLSGPMDLVRAFLAAGASGVVATLKPIDDRATQDLMVAFHREYRRHRDAAAALAFAIRSTRYTAREVGDWAAFQYIGADPAVAGSFRYRQPLEEVDP
jgi:CHAT domain-containing protein